jgi:hypothetical protein
LGSIFDPGKQVIEVFDTDVERFKKLKYLCAGAGKRVNSYLRALTAEHIWMGSNPENPPGKEYGAETEKRDE